MSSEITAESFAKSTPRMVRRFLVDAYRANLVPFIQSSPGMGKTSLVADFAREYNLKLIDISLATAMPEDMNGLPKFTENGRATFAPFDTFPLESDPLPEGKDGWLLFFDEFNAASKAIQAAAYKVVLNKEVGQHKLHQRVFIVCAGNLTGDRAITTPLSTAMQSRLLHLEMDLNPKEFMEDVAIPQQWDPRVIAFLSYKPSMLHDFRPDHNEKTFCCPRTWDFLQRMTRGQEITADKLPLYAGTITSGVAADFVNFAKIYENLPKVDEILVDPERTPIGTDAQVRYATVMHMVEHANADNFSAMMTYINRFPVEMRVIFLRNIIVRKQDLRSHPAFRMALVELSKYLNDDLPVAA